MATALPTLKWGSYYPTANNRPDIYQARQYSIGRQFDINSWFISFDSAASTHTEFLTIAQAAVPAGSATALVAWQPNRTTAFTLADILAGTYDAHIQSWADYFFTFPGPVVVRFGHEFNGNFMAWNPCASGANSATVAAVSTGGSSPTTITTTAANTLVTGQTVLITGTVGSTAINGRFDVTVVDSTHFTIPVANSATWTSGGTIAWSKVTRNVAQFISAWQYMVNTVAARATATSKTNNVKWYFCANSNDSPSTAPPMESFYPGDSYVDYVGFDNYNGLNGTYMTPLQTLQGFTNGSQANTYDRMIALGTAAQPVWIGEMNCVDVNDVKDTGNLAVGHSKASWYSALFAQDLTSIPRLQAVAFFDSPGTRNTWPFDSTTSAFNGFVSSFVTGSYNPAVAPVSVAGSPPAWTGYSLPGPEVHVPMFKADGSINPSALSLGSTVNAVWHWLNQIITPVSGWTSLFGNSDGTAPAGTFVASATGTIGQAVVKVVTAANTLKAGIALFATPTDANPTWQVNQDGSIRFGPGGATAPDVRVQRGGAATIQVTGNLTVDASVTALNSTIPIAIIANGTAPTRPTTGQGTKTYSVGDALYVGRVGRNSLIVPRSASVHGKFGYTCDPEAATSASTYTAGVLYLNRLEMFDTRTVSTIGVNVTTAGITLTNVYLGIYDTAGNLLATSVDLSTTFTSVGEKNVAMTVVAGQTMPGAAGTQLWVGLLVGSATTAPAFSSNTSAIINRSVSNSTARCASFGASQTALPATITVTSLGMQIKLLYADMV